MRTAAIQQESSQAGAGTRAQRRALAVVATTIATARSHARVLQQWGSATGPRGGRYVARSDGGRVVRDATVAGVLSKTPAGVAGIVRLSGCGVPAGRLRVQLTGSGRGNATGNPECPESRAGLPRNLTRVKVRQVVANRLTVKSRRS